MSNRGGGFLSEYGYRWVIESGYRSIKRFMAATTSKDFGLRFFYFAFACLLYSIWRAVDLLVQVELTGEYEHSPIVTADNTLTLLKMAHSPYLWSDEHSRVIGRSALYPQKHAHPLSPIAAPRATASSG